MLKDGGQKEVENQVTERVWKRKRRLEGRKALRERGLDEWEVGGKDWVVAKKRMRKGRR